MSGVDTSRGIAYQHCEAILAALDMLDDPRAHELALEVGEDVVDFSLLQPDGRLIRAAQAKTRQEPRNWAVGDLRKIVVEWSNVGDSNTYYEFLTDASLGPSAVMLAKAIEQLRQGAHPNVVTASLADASSSDLPLDVLSRVSLRTRRGSSQALLAEAEYRLLQLRQFTTPATPEDAERLINVLLREMLLRAGTSDPAKRRLSRQDVAELVGVDLTAKLELTWGVEARGRYVEALKQQLAGDPLAQILVRQSEELAPLSLVDHEVASVPVPVDLQSVLRHDVACISGAAGAGKTGSLLSLARVATGERLPIVLSASRIVTMGLGAAASDALRQATGRRLSMAGRQALLLDHSVLLLVDGAGDLSQDDRQALRRELNAAPHWKMVLTGRDSTMTQEATPVQRSIRAYDILPLSEESRREIVRLLLPQAEVDDVLAQVDRAVGVEHAGNPLILRMSLSLLSEGLNLNSLADAYLQYLTGLLVRGGRREDADELLILWGIAANELLVSGSFRAPPVTWALALSRAGGVLAALGAVSGSPPAGADSLQAVLSAGLLRRDQEALVPLHDGFAEFAIASVIDRSVLAFPQTLPSTFRQVAVLMAELSGVSMELARLACRDDPLSIVALRRYDAASDAPTESASDDVRVLLGLILGDVLHEYSVVVRRLNSDWVAAGLARSTELGDFTSEDAVALVDAGLRPLVLLRRPAGTLRLAAELLGAWIDDRLSVSGDAHPVGGIADLPGRVRDHFSRRQAVAAQLAHEAFGPILGPALVDSAGPFGVRAWISAVPDVAETFMGSHSWYPSVWESADVVEVSTVPLEDVENDRVAGRTSGDISHRLESSPEVTVASDLRSAFHNAAGEVFP